MCEGLLTIFLTLAVMGTGYAMGRHDGKRSAEKEREAYDD